MAVLTNTQATDLYTNGSLTKVDKDSAYQCHYLHGTLDGCNYYLDSSSADYAGAALVDGSTDADIKTSVIAHLETLEYQGVKAVITNTAVTKV